VRGQRRARRSSHAVRSASYRGSSEGRATRRSPDTARPVDVGKRDAMGVVVPVAPLNFPRISMARARPVDAARRAAKFANLLAERSWGWQAVRASGPTSRLPHSDGRICRNDSMIASRPAESGSPLPSSQHGCVAEVMMSSRCRRNGRIRGRAHRPRPPSSVRARMYSTALRRD